MEQNSTEKKEKREENKKFIIIVFLLLVLISIGYANFSSTLKITGQGGIDKIKWDIHFENVTEESKKVDIILPATIKGKTTDLEYKINLKEPGSYYRFYTDIKNDGTIDAKLGNEPTLTGISKEQDVYTNYTVTYSDGSPISVGDQIKAGESRKILVEVSLEKDLSIEQLPIESQDLTLTVDFDYVQAD